MVTMRFSQGFLRLIALSLLHTLTSWSLIPILTLYPEIRCDLCRDQCLIMHRDEVEARRSARLDTLVALDRLAGFGPGPATHSKPTGHSAASRKSAASSAVAQIAESDHRLDATPRRPIRL